MTDRENHIGDPWSSDTPIFANSKKNIFSVFMNNLPRDPFQETPIHRFVNFIESYNKLEYS